MQDIQKSIATEKVMEFYWFVLLQKNRRIYNISTLGVKREPLNNRQIEIEKEKEQTLK